MAYVVESADWNLNGKNSKEVLEAIERFLGCLGDAKQAGIPVWFGEEFQHQAVLGHEDLWSLSREDSPLPLPTEVWQELSAYLGQATYYADHEDWPEGFPTFIDIEIEASPPTPNLDVALAHHSIRAGIAMACVGLWRRGVFLTSSSTGTANVDWVNNEASAAEFWRTAIDIEGNSHAAFERNAPRAYPRLYFHTGVLHQAANFSGGYHANAPELKRYLAILNDNGHWAFTAAPPCELRTDPPGKNGLFPTKHLVQRRFEQLSLVVAPENPNVFKDGMCRRAREIEINSKVLYCEWHCKLEAHQNRIHVHGPVTESDDKLIIAIFVDHLPLP